MFDGKYFEWNQKRIKGIIDFYGFKFFYFKRILDLGCGHGDVSGALHRLGADVTGIDVRQEHLKVLGKKFPGIKTVQANLDSKWPFHGQKFDLILDLGLLCHLSDFERHLREVCASTTHLVLATAVCDSENSDKVIPIQENKAIYDLSFNGNGCRPSAAAIERILKDCGMNFKRIDNAKFNAHDYKYDWYPSNDNSTSLEKRRIWFAIKESSPIQFASPASEIAMPPITVPPSSQGYVTPIIDSGIPVSLSASPRPIMPRGEQSVNINNPSLQTSFSKPEFKNITEVPQPSPIRTNYKALSLIERVRADSRQYAIITPDNFVPPFSADVRCVFALNTPSSRLWYKKISQIFPNFKVSSKSLVMSGFAKSEGSPDIIMCCLDNLQAHTRVWIDEWVSPGLKEEHIAVLDKCHAIITPSLVNAQEIWKYIPHANVFRTNKPWPALDVSPAEGNYYLYFEKSADLTDILLQSWNESWGRLMVVGSSIKLPHFATYVSDSESYVQIMKLIMGSKALIDLSENNYYDSGILNMCYSIGLPIISNNHIKLADREVNIGNNFTLVSQDKRVSLLPTVSDIKFAMEKFISFNHTKAGTAGIGKYNSVVMDSIKKMVGF